jgi:hypothetical protein
VLSTNSRGTLVPLAAGGAAGQELAVPGRQLHTVVSAELDGQSPVELCCLTSSDDGATTALGVGLDGKELWRYPLPAGVHSQPIEMVCAGKLAVEGAGAWLLAAADGSVHVLGGDGKLIDRFNTGHTLTGLAAAILDGRPTLLISTTAGLTAWTVEAN